MAPFSQDLEPLQTGAIHFTIEIVDTAEEAEATTLPQLIMHEIHRAAVVDGLWYSQ